MLSVCSRAALESWPCSAARAGSWWRPCRQRRRRYWPPSKSAAGNACAAWAAARATCASRSPNSPATDATQMRLQPFAEQTPLLRRCQILIWWVCEPTQTRAGLPRTHGHSRPIFVLNISDQPLALGFPLLFPGLFLIRCVIAAPWIWITFIMQFKNLKGQWLEPVFFDHLTWSWVAFWW